MIETTPTATKLSLRYKKGAFTYSRIKTGSDSDKIYALAQAINSLQDEEPAQEIRKITESRIDSYVD